MQQNIQKGLVLAKHFGGDRWVCYQNLRNYLNFFLKSILKAKTIIDVHDMSTYRLAVFVRLRTPMFVDNYWPEIRDPGTNRHDAIAQR